MRVDGYSQKLNKVYEFLGDFYHGNPTKFDPDKYNKVCKKTYGELLKRTIVRRHKIIRLGYDYEEIWEEDWTKMTRGIVYNKENTGITGADMD